MRALKNWVGVLSCAALSALAGCGSSDSGASGGGAGIGGGNGEASAPLFGNAPACAGTTSMQLRGTLDGTALVDDPFGVSNLEYSDLQAGEGYSDGVSFGWALEAFVAQHWVKGEKQAMTEVNGHHSYLWVPSGHPLQDTYLCITSGEVGPLSQSPAGHLVFQWHITGLTKGTMPVGSRPCRLM